MSELLPSELARLILGYFESKGHTKTAETMLTELPELSEINQRRKKGRKVNLRVGNLCLIDMLDDYATSKDTILETTTDYPATFFTVKKVQLLSEQVKSLLEMILNCKTYKASRKNVHPKRCVDHQALKFEPATSMTLGNSISIKVGEYDNPKSPLEKRLQVNATPESSLPGSSKRQIEIPEDSEGNELLEKSNESNPDFIIDSTPQKRKGSLRKKSQPSPKLCSKSGLIQDSDERMEKLIKNLIENTALHTKIADSINSTLFTGSDNTGGRIKDAAPSEPEFATHKGQPVDNSQRKTLLNLSASQDQNISLGFGPGGDKTSGSKTSLSDNVISNLSLQFTNDPMMESILASIELEPQPCTSSNRALLTPVPSLSPSHSNLSSCNVYGSFQHTSAMQDVLTQPLNQSSNFILEHCIKVREYTKDNNKPQLSRMQEIESNINSGVTQSLKNRKLSLEECLGNEKAFQGDKDHITLVECLGNQTAPQSNDIETLTLVECFRMQDEKISSKSPNLSSEGSIFDQEPPDKSDNLKLEKYFEIQNHEICNENSVNTNAKDPSTSHTDENKSNELKDTNLNEVITAACEKSVTSPCLSKNTLINSNFILPQDDLVKSIENLDISSSSPQPAMAKNISALSLQTNFEFQGKNDRLCEDYLKKDISSKNIEFSTNNEIIRNEPEVCDTGQLSTGKEDTIHLNKKSDDLATEFQPKKNFNSMNSNSSLSYENNHLDNSGSKTVTTSKEIVMPKNVTEKPAETLGQSIKIKPRIIFVSNENVKKIINIKDFPADKLSDVSKEVEDENSMHEFIWPRTPQHYIVQSQLPQNFSPMNPPTVRAVAVVNSNDMFVNSKYFSGTPEHPNNYTFAELTPLPTSHQVWEIPPESVNPNTQVYEASPSTQVLIPVPLNAIENLNTDGNHFVVLSEQSVMMHGTIVPTEHSNQEVGIPDKGSTVDAATKPLPEQKQSKKEREKSNPESQSENIIDDSSVNQPKKGVKKRKDVSMNLKTKNALKKDKKTKITSTTLNKRRYTKRKKICENSSIEKSLVSDTDAVDNNSEDILPVSSEHNFCNDAVTDQSPLESSYIIEDNIVLGSMPSADLKLNSENTLLKLVDEIENKNVNEIMIANNISASDVLKIPIEKNMISSKSASKVDKSTISINYNKDNSQEIEKYSPRLKSLILFSDSFKLRSNLKRTTASPLSSERIKRYKGSLSTPRHRSNHIRALDFSTPKKLFYTKNKSPKAKATLHFPSPSPSKRMSPLSKKLVKNIRAKFSPHQNKPLEIILETSENDISCIPSSKGFQTQTEEISSEKIDNNLLANVEEDLFISEDESCCSTATIVFDSDILPISNETLLVDELINIPTLQTPGKDCVPVCLEPITPFPLNSTLKACPATTGKDLNTPVPGFPSTSKGKSPYLKAYPQGPYSNSTEGSSYYQPSERSVSDSPTYSPLQDDIEKVLIKTAQLSEIEMAKLIPEAPNEPDIEQEDDVVDDTDTNVDKIFDGILKNRPKYTSRKLSNKELGKVIEQEMELFKQMKELVKNAESNGEKDPNYDNNNSEISAENMNDKEESPNPNPEKKLNEINSNDKKVCSNPKPKIISSKISSNDKGECSNSKPKRRSSRISSKNKQCNSKTDKNLMLAFRKGKIFKNSNGKINERTLAFENFGFDFELLQMHAMNILRNSHIPSAISILGEIEYLCEKEKSYVSDLDKEIKINSFLHMITYYGTPEIVSSLKKKLRRFLLKKKKAEILPERGESSTENAKHQGSNYLNKCDEEVIKISSEVSKNKNVELDTEKYEVTMEFCDKDKSSKSKNLVGEQSNKRSVEHDVANETNKEINKIHSEQLCQANVLTENTEACQQNPSIEKPKISKRTTNKNLKKTKSKSCNVPINYNNLSTNVSPKPTTSEFNATYLTDSTNNLRDTTSKNCQISIMDCVNKPNSLNYNDNISPSLCIERLQDELKSCNAENETCNNKNKEKRINSAEMMIAEVLVDLQTKGKKQATHKLLSKKKVRIPSPTKTPDYDKTFSNDEDEDGNDEYSVIERQLAALDGSVANSPSIREELSSNILNDENISVMFTPSSHVCEGKDPLSGKQKFSEEALKLLRHKENSNSLMCFTLLPETPEKQVEEMCQTIVKNKLGLVAFPQYSSHTNEILYSEEKNNGKKLPSQSNEHGEILKHSDRAIGDLGDNDSVLEGTFCSLSYSHTFDLLSLNLCDKKIRIKQINECSEKEKIPLKRSKRDSGGKVKVNSASCSNSDQKGKSLQKDSKRTKNSKPNEEENKQRVQQRSTRPGKRKIIEVLDTKASKPKSKTKVSKPPPKTSAVGEKHLDKNSKSPKTKKILPRKSKAAPKISSSNRKLNFSNPSKRKSKDTSVEDNDEKISPSTKRNRKQKVTPPKRSRKKKDNEEIPKTSSRGKAKICPPNTVKALNSKPTHPDTKKPARKPSKNKGTKKGVKTPNKLSKNENPDRVPPNETKIPDIELDDTLSLKELQLSFSDSNADVDSPEKSASNQSEISKSFLKGGESHISDSPQQDQTPISKLRSQDNYVHYNEESMFSIPPTPGKHILLPPNEFYESTYPMYRSTSSLGCRNALFTTEEARRVQYSTPCKDVIHNSPEITRKGSCTNSFPTSSEIAILKHKESNPSSLNLNPVNEKLQEVDDKTNNQGVKLSSSPEVNEKAKNSICDAVLIDEAAAKLTKNETKNIKKLLELIKSKK